MAYVSIKVLYKSNYYYYNGCERTNMAYKCKIFEAVNLTLHGYYTYMCTISKIIGINTENQICLPNKEYLTGH